MSQSLLHSDVLEERPVLRSWTFLINVFVLFNRKRSYTFSVWTQNHVTEALGAGEVLEPAGENQGLLGFC